MAQAISLGKKNKYSNPSSPDKGPQISYPCFSVDDIELPLGSSHVGKTIRAVVELKVLKAGPEIDEYGDKQKKHRARFEVRSITLPNMKIQDLKDIVPKGDGSNLDQAEEQEFHLSKLGRLA